MGTREDIPPYLAKAAELFFEEVGSHLEAIENLVNSCSTDELTVDARSEIGKRFHTIRGGAGFLKLEQIAALAAAGEKESAAETITTERVVELTSGIRRLSA